MLAFVQLADAWGDPADSLGLQRDFRARVKEHTTDRAVPWIIVMPSRDRVKQDAEAWGSGIEIRVIGETDWMALPVSEVLVSCRGARRTDADALDQSLRQAGFRRAGRPWGQAGDARRYRRAKGLMAFLRGAAAESRVRAGATVVQVRDHWLDPARRKAWSERRRVRRSRNLSQRDVLDDRYGRPLPPVPIVHIQDLLPADTGRPQQPWSVSFAHEQAPSDVAMACHEEHGVWPLSFSYPGVPRPVEPGPTELIAAIVPGYPYSFDDVDAYLDTYRRAYLGLTHRKAGWDCFRHVEILAAGAVPLMPDAMDIPEYSMVHYPKRALVEAVNLVKSNGSPPDQLTRMAFRQHFEQHLTSRSMAEYLLEISGFGGSRRVLFVDERLPHHADYMSVMTLIGLKQLLGRNCDVAHTVDYIYEDTSTDTSTLYGRGFGYSRVVPPNARSRAELGDGVDHSSYDAIIVGSIARNANAVRRMLAEVPADRMIWIHGEDTPPEPQTVHDYRTSGAKVFVRAIHTGRG